LSEYDFETAAELALLQQLCETVDRLRQIQSEIKQAGLLATGYKGQLRASPLLAAEDGCRKTILALCRALRLSASAE
jgi:P27 family predicted phage terminase small subunit